MERDSNFESGRGGGVTICHIQEPEIMAYIFSAYAFSSPEKKI